MTKGFTDAQICRGLATAGIIGNLTKTNASISGAECGCQAEIGTACSMAAAALAELYHQNLDQVEYAAEVAMEHHLGLTCDPICGLVQIPCIERNAVAAVRAMNACNLSYFLTGSRNISYDMVCRACGRPASIWITASGKPARAALPSCITEGKNRISLSSLFPAHAGVILNEAVIAPGYGQIGGGIQYELPIRTEYLKKFDFLKF